MNKYSKYRPNLNKVEILSVQECTYRKTSREEFRINPKLKELVVKECKLKDMTKTDFYTKLAMHYFSKVGKVEGYKKKELVYGVDWEL